MHRGQVVGSHILERLEKEGFPEGAPDVAIESDITAQLPLARSWLKDLHPCHLELCQAFLGGQAKETVLEQATGLQHKSMKAEEERRNKMMHQLIRRECLQKSF
jgi:hypothetical protein